MKFTVLLSTAIFISTTLMVSPGCGVSTIQGAMRDGAWVKLNCHVITGKGVPVSNAVIEVGFYQNKRPGKNPVVKGTTDGSGLFVAEDKCMYDVGISVSKEGFYDSREHLKLTQSGANPIVKDGKWQPYGREVLIELRERRNPIVVDIVSFDAEVPKLNEEIGYDIKTGDFIFPYGKGVVADFYLSYSYKIWPMRHSDACIRLTFPNALDGAYRRKKDITPSVLKMDYHANTNAVYAKDILLERKYEAGDIEKKVSSELKEDEYLVLRTRTKVNKKGELVEANYAMIMGEFKMWVSPSRIIFTSFINPRVNDANLEYDRYKKLYRKVYR